MTMFELYRTIMKHMRCPRWVFRLDPAGICLALALVFFSAIGALAQDMTAPNARPVADAGDDQEVASGAVVTLDASGSTDRGGTISSWAWTRTGGTGSAVTLSDASVERPTFTADTLSVGAADVTHEFTLTVTDNDGLIAVADTVTVTVTSPFVPTVANAGPDQTVGVTETVQFDGTDTTVDRRRTIVSWNWTVVGTSIGSAARVALPISAFGARSGESRTITLTVVDSAGNTSTDTMIVTATNAPVADTSPPEFSFVGVPDSHDGTTPFDMEIVFSEPVTGFTASDIKFYVNEQLAGSGGARELADNLLICGKSRMMMSGAGHSP